MLTKELGNVDDSAGAHWRDYYALTKPGVVQLLVFTAIVGMFLAVPGMVQWSALIAGSLGIGLAAAAGAVVNQILDQRIDAQMARTRNRPLPGGRIGERDALAFAMGLGLAGLAVLVLQLCLGVSIVWLGVPLALAVLHNGVAALLLLAVINANQRIRQR